MPLEESLTLDISDALSKIDDVESALGAAAQSFATALNEATAVLQSMRIEEVDTSVLTTALDEATSNVDVRFDEGSITSQLDQAVAAATGEVPATVDEGALVQSIDAAASTAAPEVNVAIDEGALTDSIDNALSNVDTSGLTDQLDQAGGAASSAAGGIGELGSKLDAVAPAAALATGEFGALKEVAGKLGPEAAGFATAAGGLAVATDKLFNAALEQQTAVERVNRTFGDMAKQIEGIHIAGFAGDLADLAVKTGANVDGLRNVAANIGLMGQASGAAKPQIADTAEGILRIAERASVANPNLGTADQIVQRLSTSLARGGRFLAQYGIALTAQQITQEAVNETGKQTPDIYDKISAGVRLATTQLGGAAKINDEIVKGSQSSIVQLRSLKAGLEETFKSVGAPLIQPVLDLLKELEPAAADLARILGPILGASVEALGVALKFVDVPLHLLAQGAEEAAPAFNVLGKAMGFMLSPASAVAGVVGHLTGLFGGGSSSADKLSKSIDEVVKSSVSVGSSLDETNASLTQGITANKDLSGALAKTGVSAQDLVAAAEGGGKGIKDLGDKMEENSGHAKSLEGDIGNVKGAAKELESQLRETAHTTLTSAVAAGELSRADEVAAIKAHTAKDGHVDWLLVLRQLQPQLDKSAGAAQNYGVEVTAVTSAQQKAFGLQQGYQTALTGTQEALARGAVSQGKLTQATLDHLTALNVTKTGAVDWKAVLDSIDPSLSQLAGLQTNVSQGLDTTATKFQAATTAGKIFQGLVNELLSPLVSADQAFVTYAQDIDKTTAALLQNGNTIDISTKKGQDNRQVIDTLVTSGANYVQKLIEEGANQQTVNAAQESTISQLKVLEQKYPALAPLLDPYIAKLQEVPPNVAAVNQTAVQPQVNAGPAIQGLDDILIKLDVTKQAAEDFARLQIFAPDLTRGSHPNFAMAGGDFRAFEPVIVGEAGPEVVTFPQQFTVHPHDKPPPGGDTTIIVNEVAQDPQATAMAVATRLGITAKR